MSEGKSENRSRTEDFLRNAIRSCFAEFRFSEDNYTSGAVECLKDYLYDFCSLACERTTKIARYRDANPGKADERDAELGALGTIVVRPLGPISGR